MRKIKFNKVLKMDYSDLPRNLDDELTSYVAEYGQNGYYSHKIGDLNDWDEEYINDLDKWLREQGCKEGETVIILFEW